MHVSYLYLQLHLQMHVSYSIFLFLLFFAFFSSLVFLFFFSSKKYFFEMTARWQNWDRVVLEGWLYTNDLAILSGTIQSVKKWEERLSLNTLTLPLETSVTFNWDTLTFYKLAVRFSYSAKLWIVSKSDIITETKCLKYSNKCPSQDTGAASTSMFSSPTATTPPSLDRTSQRLTLAISRTVLWGSVTVVSYLLTSPLLALVSSLPTLLAPVSSLPTFPVPHQSLTSS